MSSVKRYVFRRTARTRCFLLAALCLASTLPSSSAEGEGLNCETSFPTSTFWEDYFERVGDYVLFHDDECGMSVNLDPFTSTGIGTIVRKELQPYPHRFVLRLFLRTEDLPLGHGDSITVYRASDVRSEGQHATSWPDPDSLLELRVEGGIKGSHRLRALVKEGAFIHSKYVTGYSSRGTHLELDVSKSTMAESEDGRVEVRITETPNEYEPAVFSNLDLWNRLPSVLDTGAVAASGFDSFGRVVFQPGELTQQYFVTTPQVPPI